MLESVGETGSGLSGFEVSRVTDTTDTDHQNLHLDELEHRGEAKGTNLTRVEVLGPSGSIMNGKRR